LIMMMIMMIMDKMMMMIMMMIMMMMVVGCISIFLMKDASILAHMLVMSTLSIYYCLYIHLSLY